MIEIAPQVYLEDRFPGPRLGLVVLTRGLVLIDTPPCPDAAQTWQHAIRAMNGGFPDRVLVLLDHHPDRSLGAPVVDGTVMAHEATVDWFQSNPNYFRSQTDRRGHVWETCRTLQHPQWPHVHVAYTGRASIYFGDTPVYLLHRPGPAPGATWVEVPHARVLFIGDAVVLREPPSLEEADLPVWLEQLARLKEAYRGWVVVGGRDGLLDLDRDVAEMEKRLRAWQEEMQTWARQKLTWSRVSRKVEAWLDLWQPRSERQAAMFRQRLLHGVAAYYRRHYVQPRRKSRRR